MTTLYLLGDGKKAEKFIFNVNLFVSNHFISVLSNRICLSLIVTITIIIDLVIMHFITDNNQVKYCHLINKST